MNTDERGFFAFFSGTLINRPLKSIAQNVLPHIALAQIHAALSYYYDHQDEIEAELMRNRGRFSGTTAHMFGRGRFSPPDEQRIDLVNRAVQAR